MTVKRKKLLIVGGRGALTALAPFAEKEGWQVITVPDWAHGARKLATVKVSACVSGFPEAEVVASIHTLLGDARWTIFDAPRTSDDVTAARSMGAHAIFFIGHVTPGAILRSLT